MREEGLSSARSGVSHPQAQDFTRHSPGASRLCEDTERVLCWCHPQS